MPEPGTCEGPQKATIGNRTHQRGYLVFVRCASPCHLISSEGVLALKRRDVGRGPSTLLVIRNHELYIIYTATRLASIFISYLYLALPPNGSRGEKTYRKSPSYPIYLRRIVLPIPALERNTSSVSAPMTCDCPVGSRRPDATNAPHHEW